MIVNVIEMLILTKLFDGCIIHVGENAGLFCIVSKFIGEIIENIMILPYVEIDVSIESGNLLERYSY